MGRGVAPARRASIQAHHACPLAPLPAGWIAVSEAARDVIFERCRPEFPLDRRPPHLELRVHASNHRRCVAIWREDAEGGLTLYIGQADRLPGRLMASTEREAVALARSEIAS